MTIERSHGKARPTLPRSGELTPDPEGADRERPGDRDDKGRAMPGNQLGLGRGWKSAIRKNLKRAGAPDEVAVRVISDTETVYAAIIRDLARTGPLVRMNAAGAAREFALAGFFDQAALEAGLMTEKGQQLAARASSHRQRYERLSVTTKDLSKASIPRKTTRSAAATIRAELAKGASDAG